MASEIKMAGVPALTINNIVNILSSSYISIIKNGGKFKDFPSVMLSAQPGVGKSQSIREIAKFIETNTNKKVYVHDIRLLLLQPIDLMGLPVADEKKTKAVWLTPEMFQLDPSDEVVNIMFLDEITACSPSLMAAAYQLVLDRKVGKHTLPDNTIVIAAGNRVTDKSVAFKMPKALANRFLHFDISSDFENWKTWAMHNGIHPIVLGFLSFRPDLLNTFDPNNDTMAFATPRSYELVSNILNNISENVDAVYSLIAGLVGTGIAIEMRSWYKIYCNLPKTTDIFKGKECIIPKDSSALFALCCSLIKHVSSRNISHQEIMNSLKYASQFPKEFFILLVTEYLNISNELREELVTDSEFSRLVGNKSLLLNGRASNGYFRN